ncbi:alpha-1,4-N-acetylglucosaminyltransferase-like [Homarus americanus]|nr:alpha-1,4-N-acetylglucosaminyltransferase-like [Homarus americanus]
MTYPAINHTHPLIQVLSRLSNVRLAWLNLDQVFADEPLRTWHRERLWMMNENRMSTVVSDAARVELLRRYGGTYLDLDALTLRPLPNTTNYLARIHDRLVSNAIISVTSGHPLMKMVADNIPSVFDATSCCSIGPELITRQLHRLCPDNVTIPASVGPNETETCGDVTIWPSKMFIPIHYGYLRHQLQSMFREGEGLGPTFIRNTEAFSLHLFNSVSHRRSVSLDEDSILKEVAIRNCPRIVELLRKYRTHL